MRENNLYENKAKTCEGTEPKSGFLVIDMAPHEDYVVITTSDGIIEIHKPTNGKSNKTRIAIKAPKNIKIKHIRNGVDRSKT